MAGALLTAEPYAHLWGRTTSHILEHQVACGWRSTFWDVGGAGARALRDVAGSELVSEHELHF